MCGLLKELKKAFKKKKSRGRYNKKKKNHYEDDKKEIIFNQIMAIKKPVGKQELTYNQVFETMKQLSLLPESWTSGYTIHKFVTRYMNTPKKSKIDNLNPKISDYFAPITSEDNNGNYFMETIRSYIDKVKVTDRDKILIFWKSSTEHERQQFFRDLAGSCLKDSPITLSEVSQYIIDKFNKLTYLSPNTIREYMPIEFKNYDMRIKRQGKTFENIGIETVMIKKIKEMTGRKLENMEQDLIQCQKEKIELELKFLKYRLKSKSKKKQKPKRSILKYRLKSKSKKKQKPKRRTK